MEEIKLYHKVWMALPPSSYIVGIINSCYRPYHQRSRRSVLDMELVFTTAVRWDLSLGSFRSHS